MNSYFALRALAARVMPRGCKFRCRRAAGEPAIYADRSEDRQPNSQFADQVAVQLHDANGYFLFFCLNEM